MKRSVVAGLCAAVIATLGVSSASQAAEINFIFNTLAGTPGYMGSSLDQSTELNIDNSLLLVTEVGAGDMSGLAPFVPPNPVTPYMFVSIFPSSIAYGPGSGPTMLPDPGIILTWTGSSGDIFTETLTGVDSINRNTPDQIIVQLSGMVTDMSRVFVDAPIVLVVDATQFGEGSTGVMFTNTSTISSIPEVSTWAMMALGFGALGCATFRRRKVNVDVLSA